MKIGIHPVFKSIRMKWLVRSVVVSFILLVITSFRDTGIPPSSLYISSFENVLGTSFDLKVMATSERRADLAEEVALNEIDRLSSILSSYDAGSEFSKWQQTHGEPVRISNELFEVLGMFDQWRANTDGALDAAAGSVIKVWKTAEQEQRMPGDAALEKAVSEVKQQHWVMDPLQRTATHLSSTPLLLNSFVKSYIISKVSEKVMNIEGITAAVVNIGGDIVVAGDHREMIRVIDPRADAENDIPLSTLVLKKKAIATSGNYRRGFSINGAWFSHIVDPRTGMPAGHIISSAVIADNATDAGALATAFSILTPDEAKKLALEKKAEYQIITADGVRIESDGWKSFELPVKNADVRTLSVNDQAMWNKDFEVAVNFELMRFDGRARRPFVAIWVDDSNKKTVRTVALWFNKARWLPDLKEWFHKNTDTYQNGTKDVFSISSATRPAGTYTVKWDGKNDDGEYVAPGNYTVYIEVAREHGTYQIMKQDIICKGKAQKFNLGSNPEVSAASVEYRKVTNSK
jgi:FAD:protein FMN transferase